MKSFAILTDVTKCTGCETCVTACKQTNEIAGNDAPWKWQGKVSDLSSTRWTTIQPMSGGRFVRLQCRHCLEPACAAACPVGALKKSPEGAVTYNPDICLGCRYCMVACPFSMTRYEWESANPRVRKCILCYDKVVGKELDQPACTATCPTKATIFGERDALLAEARKRIEQAPDLYRNHIWGEHEVGGTSVLYISDVDLATAGWPEHLRDEAIPHLADQVLATVPATFLSVGAVMAGVHWVVKRRQKLAVETAADDAVTGDADANPETPADNTEE